MSDTPQTPRLFNGEGTPTNRLRPQDLSRLVSADQVTIHPQGLGTLFTRHFQGSTGADSTVCMLAADGHCSEVSEKPCAHSPVWSADGTQWAYLSDKDRASTLLVVSLASGHQRTLAHLNGFVRNPQWSPDGLYLALEVLDTPDPSDRSPRVIERLRYVRNGLGYTGTHYWQVVLVETATGTWRYLGPTQWPHLYPAWSPDSKHLAVTTTRRSDWDREWLFDVYTTTIESTDWTQISHEDGFAMMPAWSRDGSYLTFFHNHTPDTGTTKDFHLVRASFEGSPGLRCLTHNLDAGALMAEPPDLGNRAVQLPGGDEWLWVANLESHQTLMATDLKGHSEEMGRDVGWPSTVSDTGEVAVLSWHFDRPGEVAVVNLKEAVRRVSVLTDLNPWLALARPTPHPPTFMTIPTSTGSHPLTGWWWTPDVGHSPHPTLLLLHGGPHGATPPYFGFLEALLLSCGFAIAAVNFRGSAGFGSVYADEIRGNWGPKDSQDAVDFLSYVTEAGLAERKRCGVYGGSYGGFLTNWVITHYPDAVQAAVSMSTISDLAVEAYGIDHWESIAHDAAGSYPFDLTIYTTIKNCRQFPGFAM